MAILKKNKKLINKDINTTTKTSNKKFRILSIDGGGLKGVFTVYAIFKLKEEYGIDLFKEFDMFVGTSTGAIIVTSVLLGTDFEELYESYIEKNNKAFAKRNELFKQVNKLFLAKFDNTHFKKELTENIGEMSFEEFDKVVGKHYLFTATNISEAKPILFASHHFTSVNRRYMKMKVKDAIYSSSAAPMYFEPIVEEYTKDIIADGGLWANNPSSTALIYTLADLNIKLKDIEMLSFGQTSTQNIKFNLNSGLKSLGSINNNQASAFLTSTIAARQNFDTLSTIMIMKEKLFRYSPEKNIPGNKVDKITDEYIEYTRQYWEDNKEDLVKFIKTGINNKYSINDKKMYN